MKRKILPVTFQVDLGSASFEKRFIEMFESCLDIDLQVYRFSVNQNHIRPNPIFTIDYMKKFLGRILDSRALQQAVRKSNAEGRKVLFHGISLAVFAYPATQRNNSYIVTDWTRKLYVSIWGHSGSPTWLTFIHKKILNSQKYIFGLTDTVISQIEEDYDVPMVRQKLQSWSTDDNVDSKSDRSPSQNFLCE